MKHSIKDVDSSTTFSVIIPCYNEEHYIGPLLDDLAYQTLTPHHVVVADCASEDRTVQIAQDHMSSPPLVVVQSSDRSPAAARNAGVESIRDDSASYLVFIDADMRVPPSLLASAHRILHEHPEIDFITPAFASDGKSPLDTLIVHLINASNKRLIRHRHKVAGIGGTMIVRRTLHEKIGGFPDIDQEDAVYVAKLNEQRAKAYFMSEVVVTNSSRRANKDGALSLLLDFLPQGAHSTKAIYKLLGKAPRQYGHYEQEQ